MAFASLVNGADCGPVNPLSSLKSVYQQDRTLQQDRYLPIAGPSALGFRNAPKQYPVLDHEASHFYDAQSHGPAYDLAPLQRALTPQNAVPAWALDFNASLPPQASQNNAPAWTKDFKKDQQASRPILQQRAPVSSGAPQRFMNAPMYNRMPQQIPMGDWNLDSERQRMEQSGLQENVQFDAAFRQVHEGMFFSV